MLERIQEVLKKNHFKYETLEALRDRTAEIPVFELTCFGTMFDTWDRLRVLSAQVGFWPLFLSRENLPYLVETEQAVVDQRVKECLEFELPDTISKYLLEVNRAMSPETRSLDRLAEDRCLPTYTLQYRGSIFTDKPTEKPNLQRLVLIPAETSWRAFAHLTEFYAGGMVKKADPIPTAWVRYWEERYGAQLYLHDGSNISFYVERPPLTTIEAFKLMTEHVRSGFAVDTIGAIHFSEQSYAAHLIGSESWDFWWD